MRRSITARLKEWKLSPARKPLIVNGARQVGKTYSLREFGSSCYANTAYISLEKKPSGDLSDYAYLFEPMAEPRRILDNLSVVLGVPITPGETLVILDEIQDCPNAIGSLKYFNELANEYHIACAGSLLGVKLAPSGHAFPVGKVQFLSMYPMTFSEYLDAVQQDGLRMYSDSAGPSLNYSPVLEDRLKEQFGKYFVSGGMPAAVSAWVSTGDVGILDAVLNDLLESYGRDFAKHGGSSLYVKLSRIWDTLPAQLGREKKRFLLKDVKPGARMREYEDAFSWLEGSGLILKVPRISKPGIPLKAYAEDGIFKLYALDVGVLRALSGLPSTVFSDPPSMFTEFKGAFVENYIAQAFTASSGATPYYWTNDKPVHEVDFVRQHGAVVVPAEVKSGENVKSPSLKYYAGKYPEATPLRTRLSMKPLSFDGDMLNVPVYLADQYDRLVAEALALLGR